jgi:putative membrane protein
MMKRGHFPVVLLALSLVALGASAIRPNDRLTWVLEVGPVLAGLPVLVLTYRRFPLSHLVYAFLWVHSIILIVGGHYTYAEVPLGSWVQGFFDLSRNPYDRLGHFAQGFVPALLAREILKRRSPLGQSWWLPVLVVCFCLALSAVYELFEWWSALALGQSADQFLGTQGDVWDTQWDMFLALTGATLSLILLSKAHDRSLAKVTNW